MKSHHAEWRAILQNYLDAVSQLDVAMKDARQDLEIRGVEASAVEAVNNLSERLGARVESLLAIFDAEAKPRQKGH